MATNRKRLLISAALVFLILMAILIVAAIITSKRNQSATTLSGPAAISLQNNPVRTGSITAANPKADDQLKIASVTLSKPGFVIVHEEDGNSPSRIIGKSELLPAETSKNINVKLTRTLKSGETIFAIIYYDDDNNGYFEYPSLDMPAQNALGQTVLAKLTVL